MLIGILIQNIVEYLQQNNLEEYPKTSKSNSAINLQYKSKTIHHHQPNEESSNSSNKQKPQKFIEHSQTNDEVFIHDTSFVEKQETKDTLKKCNCNFIILLFLNI